MKFHLNVIEATQKNLSLLQPVNATRIVFGSGLWLMADLHTALLFSVVCHDPKSIDSPLHVSFSHNLDTEGRSSLIPFTIIEL